MLGTYGEHQEAAAAALHELLGHMSARRHSGKAGHNFGTEAQQRLLLQRREAVLDALSDRIRLWTTPGVQPKTAARVKVSDLGHETLPLLMGVIEERDRLPREQRQSPLDVLDQAATEQTPPGQRTDRVGEELELWRQAAIELAAANHVLTTGEQDWFYQPAAFWPVLADTATAAEAVIVLDEELRRSGIQAQEQETRGTARQDALSARLIAGHTVRVARWQTTSEAADTLRAPVFDSIEAEPAAQDGPKVRLVHGLHDVAPAMHQLSRFVAPVRLSSASADQEPQMGVRLLRPLAASWIEALEHVERLAGPAGEGYQFDNHRESLGKLYNAMRTMVDTDPKTTAAASREVVAQQSEIVRGLGVAAKDGGDVTLAPAEQRALIAAAHEVGHQIGRRVNQEVDRPDTQLQGRGGFPLASSRARGQAAGAARELTEIPRPPSVVEAARARQRDDVPRPPGRVERDGLRATLDTTPSPGTASGIPGGLAAESYPVKVSDQLHDALSPDQVAAYDHNAANRTRSGRRRKAADKDTERDQ